MNWVQIPFKLQLQSYKYHKQQKAIHKIICKYPRLFARNVEKNQIIPGEMWLAKQTRSVHKQYSPQATQIHQTLARTRPRPPKPPPKLHESNTSHTFLFLLLNTHCYGGASETIFPSLNSFPQSR